MENLKKPYEKTVFVCVNERPAGQDACANRNSRPIYEKLKAHVREAGLKGKVRVSRVYCLGLCSVGPNVAVFPENAWYSNVHEEDVDEIIKKHLSV